MASLTFRPRRYSQSRRALTTRAGAGVGLGGFAGRYNIPGLLPLAPAANAGAGLGMDLGGMPNAPISALAAHIGATPAGILPLDTSALPPAPPPAPPPPLPGPIVEQPPVGQPPGPPPPQTPPPLPPETPPPSMPPIIEQQPLVPSPLPTTQQPVAPPPTTDPVTTTTATATPSATGAAITSGVTSGGTEIAPATSLKGGGGLASPIVTDAATGQPVEPQFDPIAAALMQLTGTGGSGTTAPADAGAAYLSYDQGGVVDEPVVGRGMWSGRTIVLAGNGRPERVTPMKKPVAA